MARRSGQGCAVCAGKVVVPGINDLETTHPNLASEFDVESNFPLTTKSVMAGTNRALHWKCPLGHKYVAMGAKRALRGDSCPVCSRRVIVPGVNDLATTHQVLASTWSASNISTPDSVSAGSSKKFLWVCPVGHADYSAAVKNRLHGHGCPVCKNKAVEKGINDLASVFPSLAIEWDHAKNTAGTPSTIAPYTHKKFWWICNEHGSYLASAAHRSNGRGCPSCAETGFDERKPGIFYFIENPALGAKKFGITNTASREDRLAGFAKRGWNIILKIESQDGFEIAKLETEIFRWIRKDLGLPVFLSRQDIGKIGGWTETLSADGLETQLAISHVKTELERIRNTPN